MKKSVLLFAFFCLLMQSQAFAQSDSLVLFKRKDPSWPLYERKVQKFQKMKTTGIVMGVAGAALTVAGITMISKANWRQQSNYYGSGTNYTTDDPNGITGVLFVLAGVPIATTGVILGAIGGRKVKYYRKKLEGLSVNMHYAPQQQGVSIAYRF